ncbi:DUF7144 family membrane protein [Actinomycetospora straminea]|uniref:DUF7144 domain-containing protein n=1 Tax=Actinomycetospora straminea TaxID=663607 RepID=A0ABP9EJP1_9PSEU|nr:hypothetical protein [Actinomycetospora straminea]MDD7933285.1 hypothetical protein [Actinomycetospora straminea]
MTGTTTDDSGLRRERTRRLTGTRRDPGREWVRFGAVMMVVLGAFAVVEGVIALAAPATYVTVDGEVLALDLDVWGWTHLVLGALVLATGVSLVRDADAPWARIMGVTVVGLGMLVQLLWLPAAPIWSMIVIALDVLVLAALLGLGDDTAATPR